MPTGCFLQSRWDDADDAFCPHDIIKHAFFRHLLMHPYVLQVQWPHPARRVTCLTTFASSHNFLSSKCTPFAQTSVRVNLMQLVHDLPHQCVSTFKMLYTSITLVAHVLYADICGR